MHALASVSIIGGGTALAHAETYEVKAGDSWEALADKLVAGDEIVLLEGVHRPAILSGLEGTREQPIVIRSWARSKLAEIAPDREGLKLVDCRHVRVERILVRNARRAGIVIEGSAPGRCEGIAVHDSLVVGVAGLAEQAGVLVSGAADVEIQRSRFDECRGSAVHLENARAVRAERLQMRAQKECTFGILLLGRTTDVEFNDAWIAGRMQTAVSIGVKDAPVRGEPTAPIRLPEPVRGPRPTDEGAATPPQEGATPPATSPAAATDAPEQRDDDAPPKAARVENATFTQLLIHSAPRAFEFGSCALVNIGNSTIVDPTESVFRLVRVPKEVPAAGVRFHDNLVAWTPGRLKEFTSVIEGAETSGLRLGPNIWWSNELPAALPLLGPEENPFQATIEVPQTIDLDPDLDDRSRPLEERAKFFGRNPTA